MKASTTLSKNTYQIIGAIVLLGISISAFGQSNYVLKTGDTMTGTLSVEAQPYPAPTIKLFGTNTNYKFIHFEDTTDGAVWDISMDTSYESNRMAFWCSPNGVDWIIPFYITTNGVLYGNAAGLTNLNVAIAIPPGSISADKVSGEIVTFAAFTNDSIESLEVGGTSGMTKNSTGSSSLTVGGRNTASNRSFAVGWTSKAIGQRSFAAGTFSIASGDSSHAEGYSTEASGDYSHAEGWNTSATNTCAHAEGYNAKAYGQVSHAEGNATIAAGSASHAEGYLTEANGVVSHAGGFSAIANHDRTFVWSSSDDSSAEFSSTTNRQFSVYADNGIRLEAGSNATVEVVGLDLSDIGCYGDIPMFGE